VPEPATIRDYSGKVLVRMPKSLHNRLIERAEDEGVSANQTPDDGARPMSART
jgi:predicted HicB family RNase H-like nuclease